MYHPTREENEAAIRLLVEKYPRCFFEDPKQRRPLKRNLIADLLKDGVPLAPELLSSAITWYQSHFGYHYALQAGAKRIDLNGKEVTTVTEQEAKNAQKYIHEQKLKERERRNAMPMLKEPKATTVIKTGKSIDPFASIEQLLDAVRVALVEQPEALRRPFAAAGLRVVISEIEKTIVGLSNEKEKV